MKNPLHIAIASIACSMFLLGAPLLAQAPREGGPVAIGQAHLDRDPATGGVALIQAPAAAVIDTGTIAGQALTWVVTTFGGSVGIMLTVLLQRMLKRKNIEITAAQLSRFQELVVNGLNLGAAEAAKRMQGAGKIEIKNAAVARTIEYVQMHGADTLKSLGFDPTSPAAVDAIRARIESAITDPNTATHPAVANDNAAAVPKAA